MKFSYRIDAAQYAQAWTLRRKAGKQQKLAKAAIFWVFILVCLVLLWGVIQHNAGSAPSVPVPDDADHVTADHPFTSLIQNVFPLCIFLGIWIFILFGSRRQLRKLYYSDPAMQGIFTVEITPETFHTENTAGASGQTGWNIYDGWCEDAKNHLIVLIMKSQAYFVVSTVDLSEAERDELRGVLQRALPRK